MAPHENGHTFFGCLVRNTFCLHWSATITWSIHAKHGGKEEEKTLIPGPVWYVEKLILAQHCFKPAPAAIGNVPWSSLPNTSQIFSKCETKFEEKL